MDQNSKQSVNKTISNTSKINRNALVEDDSDYDTDLETESKLNLCNVVIDRYRQAYSTYSKFSNNKIQQF